MGLAERYTRGPEIKCTDTWLYKFNANLISFSSLSFSALMGGIWACFLSQRTHILKLVRDF